MSKRATKRAEAAPALAPAPERHQGLDALKGLLIICVVLGHLPHGPQGPGAALAEAVYIFHIPAFLVLSGLHVPGFSAGWSLRRAWALLLPYVVWQARPDLLFQPKEALRALYEAQKGLAWGNWQVDQSYLWFLPALLASNLLLAASLRLPARWRWGLALGGALLVWSFAAPIAAAHAAGKVPWSLDVAVYFLPFTLAARSLWGRRESLAQIPAWGWAVLAALGLALAWAFEPLKDHSPYLHRVDLAQFSVPVHPLGLLGFALILVGLLGAFAAPRAPGWLAYVGTRSLPIYVAHLYFVNAARESLEARPAFMDGSLQPAFHVSLLLAGVGGPLLLSWAARRLLRPAQAIGL